MSELEIFLVQAVGSAIVSDKSIAYVVAQQLAKDKRFLDAVIERLDPTTLANIFVHQIIVNGEAKRGTLLGQAQYEEIKKRATKLAAEKLAEKIARDVEVA